jgi:hypothetical protein
MNLQPFRLALLGSFLLFGLTGCFEVRQQLMVYPDGDADLMFTVVLSDELADLADEDDDHSAECDNQLGFEDKLPPTLTKTTNVRTEEGDVLCDVVVFGPLVDMIPVLEEYSAGQEDDDFVIIEDLNDGRFRLTGQYDFEEDGLDMDDDSSLGRAIRGAILAGLEDAEISWEIRAPHIVETNGDIRPDGSVFWSFPLSDAVINGGSRRFEVIFSTKPEAQFF